MCGDTRVRSRGSPSTRPPTLPTTSRKRGETLIDQISVVTKLSRFILAAASVAAAAGSATARAATAPPASAATQQHWVDSVLATLSLRERVGQMVMIWMLGDYTSTTDSSYAEVIRWVERDRIGGVTMSLGTPGEVATKLNDLQRRARVP